MISPLPEGPATVGLQEIASGLAVPLYLTTPPGDSRLFIVEKGGTIRIVKDGALVLAPFLDISDRVSTGAEQGLLGLAFEPSYAATGRFFVHYTDTGGNTKVSVLNVSTGNPDSADGASERPILAAAQPFANHNGGQLVFGPDGFLYLGLGDGGGGGDPEGNGQDAAELLGSILRLDASTDVPNTVPQDNPFVGRQDARGEVWSVGLRNPWRFSFDRATGDLYIGDVGQNAWEEVDVSTAAEGAGRGLNFGWNIMEGSHCFSTEGCGRAGLVLPVVEYSHGNGCSVTGGYVYRGATLPELQGHYFYSDFCSGWVRSFRLENGVAAEQRQWASLTPGGLITSFGEDADGELYILTNDGRVARLVPR